MPLHEGKASTNQKTAEVYSLSQSFSRDMKVKRKIALVVGYLGTNFRGMQIHRDAGKQTQHPCRIDHNPNTTLTLSLSSLP